ncbi:S1C family serine protease [Phaeacidiphilus oryzae]|uniref:S1C family serine protease n=1 Tax=Phaeacidiphilus oryzae TaxID=348818 RepID=UPI00055DE078|nr:trypsin-like peptidase domain-containing protein [Phaeacidiphilus oryzae]
MSPAARTVVGGVVITVLAGLLGGTVGAVVQGENQGGRVTLRPVASDSAGARRAPDSAAGIARAALPGVVYIRAAPAAASTPASSAPGAPTGPARPGGPGSRLRPADVGAGIVLDGHGRILTNDHVIAPDGKALAQLTVTFSTGQQHQARLIGRDPGSDLAVIQVSGVSGLRPLPLGDSDQVQVGDPVMAIGAPFGLEGTVTSGIVSARDRPIVSGPDAAAENDLDGDESAAGGAPTGTAAPTPAPGTTTDVSYLDTLQTDAPINPGNSGGPLLDAAGRVIGVDTTLRSGGDATADAPLDQGAQSGSVGLGFAIPMNQAAWVAEQLINNGRVRHAVLGVTLNTSYQSAGAAVALSSIAGRPAVSPGGAAARAGVRPGDVITAIAGEPVTDSDDLLVFVRAHHPGDSVPLTVRRGGRSLDLRARLTATTATDTGPDEG